MARDKQVNVLLTAETVEGLRAEAARGGVSLSEVVRGRIEGYPSAAADAEDWRRAAMARCADAERCAELEGECARLRAEIERLRGAQARRAASGGIGGVLTGLVPSGPSDGPQGPSDGGFAEEMRAWREEMRVRRRKSTGADAVTSLRIPADLNEQVF